MSVDLVAQLDSLRAACKAQGDVVRGLKAANTTGYSPHPHPHPSNHDCFLHSADLEAAVKKLQELQIELNQAVTAVRGDDKARKQDDLNTRAAVDRLLKSRFFVVPAFEIYNGIVMEMVVALVLRRWWLWSF